MTDDFLTIKQAPETRTYPMRLELTGYFSEDAFDFFHRYKLTFYSDQFDFQCVKSRRVKAYIDLRMALEVLLKAAVCLRGSGELAGRQLVREIRRYRHNIERFTETALRGIELDARFMEAKGTRAAQLPLGLKSEIRGRYRAAGQTGPRLSGGARNDCMAGGACLDRSDACAAVARSATGLHRNAVGLR